MMFRSALRHCACILLLAAPTACSGGGDTSPCEDCVDGADTTPPTPEDVYAMTLTATRDTAADPSPFSCVVTLTKNGEPLQGERLEASVTTASVSAVRDLLGGQYGFGVTPQGGGELVITVTHPKVTLTRTALVLLHVDSAWGQPMMVDGIVNTTGYEDGASVTPDGEYLFAQYGPLSFSGILLFGADRESGGCGGDRLAPSVCHHPWIDQTNGPYAEPERPGFFSGRIDTSTGAFRHNSALYEIADGAASIFAPATMFYGFHRQADGSYAEPFRLAFEDANDAIVNPYGLHVTRDGAGTYHATFSLNDGLAPNVDVDNDGTPDTPPSFDVYTMAFAPGAHVRFGGYEPDPVRPPRSASFPAARVNFGDTGATGNLGTQGNPMVATESDGTVWAVFTDDEHDDDGGADSDNISAFVVSGGSYPNATYTKVILPSVVNTSAEETQPFFAGDGTLYFRRDSDLMSSRYSGPHTAAGLAVAASWSNPRVALQHASSIAKQSIIVLGEPSIATIDGKSVLFFVYGRVREVNDASGIPDIDMQIGYVPARD